MEQVRERIAAGAVALIVEYEQGLMHDQGVRIRVVDAAGADDADILRFDCFDQLPAYQYDTNGQAEHHLIDRTTSGNPLSWTLRQLRQRLPAMLEHAGRGELAERLDAHQVAGALDKTEAKARRVALSARRTVTHNRGDVIVETGNIRFGLEYRMSGLTVHVLSDVAGQEIELLAFDCFQKDPHYHYGPRNQDIRIYWDQTLVPDPLSWVFDQFMAGRLPAMITRAGYPSVVTGLDEALIAAKLPEISATAFETVRERTGVA